MRDDNSRNVREKLAYGIGAYDDPRVLRMRAVRFVASRVWSVARIDAAIAKRLPARRSVLRKLPRLSAVRLCELGYPAFNMLRGRCLIAICECSALRPPSVASRVGQLFPALKASWNAH